MILLVWWRVLLLSSCSSSEVCEASTSQDCDKPPSNSGRNTWSRPNLDKSTAPASVNKLSRAHPRDRDQLELSCWTVDTWSRRRPQRRPSCRIWCCWRWLVRSRWGTCVCPCRSRRRQLRRRDHWRSWRESPRSTFRGERRQILSFEDPAFGWDSWWSSCHPTPKE